MGLLFFNTKQQSAIKNKKGLDPLILEIGVPPLHTHLLVLYEFNDCHWCAVTLTSS